VKWGHRDFQGYSIASRPFHGVKSRLPPSTPRRAIAARSSAGLDGSGWSCSSAWREKRGGERGKTPQIQGVAGQRTPVKTEVVAFVLKGEAGRWGGGREGCSNRGGRYSRLDFLGETQRVIRCLSWSTRMPSPPPERHLLNCWKSCAKRLFEADCAKDCRSIFVETVSRRLFYDRTPLKACPKPL